MTAIVSGTLIFAANVPGDYVSQKCHILVTRAAES